MMRTSLALAVLLVFGAVLLAQQVPSPAWTRKSYHVLMDGNELGSACQSFEKDVRFSRDKSEFNANADGDLFFAGTCRGYVLGVVDSIPAGEGFGPDPNVLPSQYIDVVFAYLRDHPEQRHLPAYGLVRNALTQAFPAKPNR